jgi:glycosyltransferase involved in cell wall biosynthesis
MGITTVPHAEEAASLRRVLYASLVDISVPSGPGVNELVFLKDMLGRYGSGLCAVIPQPSRGMPEELRGLNVVTLPARRNVRNPLGWLQARTVGALLLRRAIARFAPELIVMRFSTFPLPQVVAGRLGNVPYVLKTLGEVSLEKHYRMYPHARVARGLNTRLIRDLLRGAACIDIVSDRMRADVLSFEPSVAPRLHVIDNGVDVEHFDARRSPVQRQRFGFAPEDVVVGFVGNFPLRRGALEVIDAVAALRGTLPVKGLVVGDSGDAEECRRHAASRGVQDAVTIYGEARYSEVPGLMGCMDIGLSILRAGERGESEQKVRQYLASGLCVVGTAGSNDFLRGRPFARVVETEDAAVVAAAVRELAAPGPLPLLRQQARAFAEANLSVRARNDLRVQLWNSALRDS